MQSPELKYGAQEVNFKVEARIIISKHDWSHVYSELISLWEDLIFESTLSQFVEKLWYGFCYCWTLSVTNCWKVGGKQVYLKNKKKVWALKHADKLVHEIEGFYSESLNILLIF